MDHLENSEQNLLDLITGLEGLEYVTLNPVEAFSQEWQDALAKARPDLAESIRYY